MTHCFELTPYQEGVLRSGALFHTIPEVAEGDKKTTRLELTSQLRQIEKLVKYKLMRNVSSAFSDPKNKGRRMNVFMPTAYAITLFAGADKRPTN